MAAPRLAGPLSLVDCLQYTVSDRVSVVSLITSPLTWEA